MNDNIIFLVILAILFGWLEQHIYRNGYSDLGTHWYLINPRYHLPMFSVWAIICYIADSFWFIGLFAVIEDYFYFIFHPDDNLSKDDWIFKLLGGFSIGDRIVIPYMYLLGILISVLLLIFG